MGPRARRAAIALASRGALRAPRAWLARIGAAVVAVVMLVGVLRSGARYVYCPSMHMVIDEPCCGGDEAREDDRDGDCGTSVELRTHDCCEQHVLGKLPAAGGGVQPPQPFAAPLVATLPPPSLAESARSATPAAWIDRECRAGPRASARHRAELMVALN